MPDRFVVRELSGRLNVELSGGQEGLTVMVLDSTYNFECIASYQSELQFNLPRYLRLARVRDLAEKRAAALNAR